MELEVQWMGDQRFQARNVQGLQFLLDGKNRSAVSPTEALLGALVGCISIDIVLILEKMRCAPEHLEILVRAERAAEPPKYFTRAHLEFRIAGDVSPHRIDRAIHLSVEKYCSVYHSLRPDFDLEWTVTQLEGSPPKEQD